MRIRILILICITNLSTRHTDFCIIGFHLKTYLNLIVARDLYVYISANLGGIDDLPQCQTWNSVLIGLLLDTTAASAYITRVTLQFMDKADTLTDM